MSLRKLCFGEYRGNRQGHVRASGHYKAYINPCITSLNDSQLGFNIGPICITSVCVADDNYLLSGSKSSLQVALNIVEHYSKWYCICVQVQALPSSTGTPVEQIQPTCSMLWSRLPTHPPSSDENTKPISQKTPERFSETKPKFTNSKHTLSSGRGSN